MLCFNALTIQSLEEQKVHVTEVNELDRGDFSWKMLLIAVTLIVFGIFLMFESMNLLFEMNSLVFVGMILGALLIFSGIVLLLIAIAVISAI